MDVGRGMLAREFMGPDPHSRHQSDLGDFHKSDKKVLKWWVTQPDIHVLQFESYGTPEQRVKMVNFDVRKKAPKLIGYHSNVP